MMRDFRYLRVTHLLADGVYMNYMKITKEIREKTKFRREKLHVFQCSFFFQRIKTYCETLLRKSLSSSDYILHIVLTKAS